MYYLTNKNFGKTNLEISKDTGSSYLSFLPHLISWPSELWEVWDIKKSGEKKNLCSKGETKERGEDKRLIISYLSLYQENEALSQIESSPPHLFHNL